MTVATATPTLALTLALALPLSGAAPRPAVTAGPAPPRLTQDEEGRKQFRDEFERAMGIGSKSDMSRLVKRQTAHAVDWIMETCEAVAARPSDQLYERLTALCEAWGDAYGTDFCRKMETYFSLLDPTTKRLRLRLRSNYEAKTQEYWRNDSGDQDVNAYTRLGVEFEALTQGFAEIGDYFYESQCWLYVGTCFDEFKAKTKADLKRACKAYQKALGLREELGLKDPEYQRNKQRYDQLVGLGYGDEPLVKPGAQPPAGEGGGEPGEGEAGGPGGPLTATMEFEFLEDLDGIERPSIFLDEIYPMWRAVGLNRKGSLSPIPRLENAPDLIREGSAELLVDLDRDGQGEVEVPLTGNFEPVLFEIGEGASKRPWGFLAVTGLERDTYQNIEVNLSITDDALILYVNVGASMVGELAGVPVRVIDDNMDGVYGSVPTSWGHEGLTEGHFQPELDSLVIGKGKRAVPWSEYVQLEDQWYRLEALNGGTQILASPITVPTGELSLNYKGPKPSYVIVKGSNDFENCYFDLIGEKSVQVPIGRYSLCFGMITKGKKKQTLKAVMLPSEDTPSWDVAEGAQVEIDLGSPFGFDFKYQVEDERIVVQGDSIAIVGKANERYERLWGAVPRPEVSYRVGGARKSSRPEDMRLILDQQELYDKGWRSGWFPKDLEIEKRSSETDIEVQLTEKKNKLFGKIESIWR